MVDLTERIAGLSPEKRELLRQQLKNVSKVDHSRTGVIRQKRDTNTFPASFAQQRLWFLDQLEPNSSAYNLGGAYRLRGRLKVTALEQSLNEIVRRHEALRTSFAVIDGQPVQQIAVSLKLKLKQVTVGATSQAERAAEAERLVRAEAERPFDLSQVPLLRATLVKLGEEEHILSLIMHHIVSDGWSMGLLNGELAELYEGQVSGRRVEMSEPEIQYADYAVWQREWLQGEELARQLGYWRKQLAGAPGAIELPTDRPRPAIQSHRGAMERLRLSRRVSEGLKELGQREGVTLFMVLLAGFKVLLYRYAGQEEIVVGTPIANRNRAEIGELIGFFVNTLVMRTELRGNPSFREMLGRVREVALGAYAHQDLPFEKLVEELQPERDQSRTPLFQIFFNMLNLEDGGLKLRGLSIERLAPAEPDSKFDLTLYAREQNTQIEFKLLYNTDLFDAATITQMLDHFQNLLESIVVHPEYPLLKLSLSKEDRRQSPLVINNSDLSSFVEFKKEATEQSIPQRFEQQVKKKPKNIAIKTRDHEWTYETLNQVANRVAQAILKLCRGGEERIALLFEHDASMIAGLLGVLKVGKTYVPLDPTYPEERLAYILADSQVGAIVTNSLNQALAAELARDSLQLINVEDMDFAGDNDLKLPILPEAVAYILYTSGSTGQPKGVMQSHRNVLHHIRNYTNNLYINPSDKLTLLASYSFDAAVMDIFGALLNGATLYPINIKQEGLGSLTQCLLEQEITIYHSTPTVYRYFINSLTGKEVFSKIRLIVLGGEEVHKQDVDRYKTHFPPECIFVNGLGPTESTVSIQYFINHETRIPRSAVPVGYPVEDTEILLLDEAGEAETVYGEIAIRSPYIALGYWQRPELNQASFLPDPEGRHRRIYRTGDMGRLRPDNGFEFVGRKDSQLKIRGFRIEPGEVEAILSQHTAVREVTVVAREDMPGDKRLVAYVVPNQGQTPTTGDLRSFLNQSLPDYMVPSAFVVLDALPLTPNGKVNHLVLPAPQPSGPDQDSQDQAPKGGIEQRLARIWASLLDIEQVGRRDNFFELGGHSLLAIQLFIEIEKAFGRKLPLATLFQAPTIERLAQLISEDALMTSPGSLVAIQPQGSRPPFFCIHGIGGHVLRYYDLSFHLGEDQPFYGLQSKGLDGGQALFLTVEDMAAHYIREIQAVQPKGPYHLGGLSFGGLVAFEMARQLRREGQQVGLVALLDTYIAQAPRYAEAISKAEFIRYKLSGLTGKIQYKVQGRAENIGNLLANVSTLSLQEGLTYIRQKVGKRPNHQAKARDDTSSGQLKVDFLPPRLFQDVWQANALASREYVPKPYSGEVTLFRSSALKGTYGWDEFLDDYGWGQVARGGVRIFETPGNHLTIIEEPNVRTLAEQLKAGMAMTSESEFLETDIV